MSALVNLFLMVGSLAGWQSYTNTNFINDIAGTDSVLWLATNGGVVQLAPGPPPTTLRTFVNTDGLPTNRCACLSLDDSGNVWVGTDGGGLAVVEGESLEVLPYRTSDLALRIRALAWHGSRLLVASDQGLYVVDTRSTLLDFTDDLVSRYSVARVPELLSDQVIAVQVGERYWLGTNLGLVSVDHGLTQWRSYRRPLGDSVRALAYWRDTLLLATERGVAVLEDSTFRTALYFATPTEVFDIVTAGSSIYLATKTGLFQADAPDSTRFSVVLTEDARSVLLGRAIWVGCGGYDQAGSGLRYAVSGQGWVGHWNNCLATNVVSDCALTGSGEFYLCHGGGPISRIGPDGSVQVLYSPSPNPVQVRVDSRGRPWFAHFAHAGGLSSYDPTSGSWQTIKWGEVSAWNIIDAFGLDRFDTKWVFNGGGVIVAIDSTGEQSVFEVAGLALPPGGLYEFAFDSRSRAWLGLTVGLVMVDYAGTLFDRSDDADTIIAAGLPSPEVRTVAVDGQDRVWIGTPQGAAMWDGRELRVFTATNSPIVSNNVYRVRVDASDRVWLLCDAGLSVYDQVVGSWQNFTPLNSGIIANPQGLTSFYSALSLHDNLGRALIGTQRGLSSYSYAAPPGASAERMRVYPNPCILGRHNGLVIDSLPDDAYRVDVRTLDGRSVAELRIESAVRRAVWRPEGRSSGLYLIVVTTPRGTALTRAALVGP